MKNRIFKNDKASQPKTLGDATIAFMKSIEPYVDGIKVTVIVNDEHGFGFEYAENNTVGHALMGMSLFPPNQTAEAVTKKLEENSK